MKILITGAAGFLGRRLCSRLCSLGHEVVALVRPGTHGGTPPKELENCELLYGDLTQELPLGQVVPFPEVVIHAACSYGAKGNASEVAEVNLGGALKLLEACVSGRAGTSVLFVNVGTGLERGVNAYSLSKAQFVEWGKLACCQSDGGVQFVSLKVHTMYGYELVPTRFTSEVFHACIKKGREALRMTSGEQTRDFVHVKDVVAAIVSVVNQRAALKPFEEFDVGSGETAQLRRFVELVHEQSASNLALEFGSIPMRRGEQMLCRSDISRIKELGWERMFSLERGIRDVIEDFKR